MPMANMAARSAPPPSTSTGSAPRARAAAAAFDSHSPAAAIARAGRFVQPQGEEGSPLAGFEYGLQLNPPRYREMMRAYARHLGVTERAAGIADVRLRGEDGFVEALQLDDGSEVGGHLFVDCTGPAATLRSALDQDFEAWDRWLPCDRILFAETPPPPEPTALDTGGRDAGRLALAGGVADPHLARPRLCLGAPQRRRRGSRAAGCRGRRADRGAGDDPRRPARPALAAQLRRGGRRGGGDGAARMGQSPPRP